MKRCYFDANLLLYYQNQTSTFNGAATQIVKKLIEEDCDIVLSPLTLDEYIHNTIRFSGKLFRQIKSDLHESLLVILSLPNLKLFNPSLKHRNHLKILDLMDEYGLRVSDAYHLLIMLENKIKYFATFDSDFDKVFASGRIKKLSF